MNSETSLKDKLYTIIFEADTPAGKAFDLALIAFIIFSVFLVILESVPAYRSIYGEWFLYCEWFLTALFLTEYFLRIYCSRRTLNYVFSFFGIIDCLSSFATVLSLVIPGAQSLIVVRSLRLLRIFRILKLGRYFSESMVLLDALRASRIKISVFLFSVLIIVLVMGTTMYLIEGPEAGFTNIPISMYWAIVTLTTVGYGDIAPITSLGRILASLLMVIGYAIIAVPTGIVTSELTRNNRKSSTHRQCQNCGTSEHHENANFCHHCSHQLLTDSSIMTKESSQGSSCSKTK